MMFHRKRTGLNESLHGYSKEKMDVYRTEELVKGDG
jgi:hypothetical protein